MMKCRRTFADSKKICESAGHKWTVRRGHSRTICRGHSRTFADFQRGQFTADISGHSRSVTADIRGHSRTFPADLRGLFRGHSRTFSADIRGPFPADIRGPFTADFRGHSQTLADFYHGSSWTFTTNFRHRLFVFGSL